MKSFLLSALMLSNLAFADVTNINVKDFNFTYANPHGEGSAAEFSRNKIFDEGVYVTVDKIEKDFYLHVSGSEVGEFTFKNAPSFMTEAETMTVEGFNFLLAQNVQLGLGVGRFDSPKDSLKIDGLSLECNRDSAQENLFVQLINGCINRLAFKTAKFQQSDIRVNSADLKINSGKFDITAELKAQISGKVKGNGTVSYDSATSVLTIKFSEIKLGILSVKGQVFSELKKKETEKFKVKEPYLYITVNK